MFNHADSVPSKFIEEYEAYSKLIRRICLIASMYLCYRVLFLWMHQDYFATEVETEGLRGGVSAFIPYLMDAILTFLGVYVFLMFLVHGPLMQSKVRQMSQRP